MDDALFAVLRSWLLAVLPELTAVVRSQDGEADEPQPAAPYAALRLRTDVPEARPYKFTSAEPDTAEPGKTRQYLSQRHQSTLVVDLYGKGAMAMGDALILSLSRGPRKILRDADLALRHLGGLGDTTGLDSTRWSPSAQIEFALHRVVQAVEATPWIETVSVEIDAGG